MKKLILVVFAVVLFASMISCTKNSRARTWGGIQTINLEPGKKLVIATWKEDDLWILTKDMTDSDVAESYSFKEDSSFGVLEGEVLIKESRK